MARLVCRVVGVACYTSIRITLISAGIRTSITFGASCTTSCRERKATYDDVMTGKRFLHYTFIVRESETVDSPRKGPVMQTFGFFLLFARPSCWINIRQSVIWDSTTLMWRHWKYVLRLRFVVTWSNFPDKVQQRKSPSYWINLFHGLRINWKYLSWTTIMPLQLRNFMPSGWVCPSFTHSL